MQGLLPCVLFEKNANKLGVLQDDNPCGEFCCMCTCACEAACCRGRSRGRRHAHMLAVFRDLCHSWHLTADLPSLADGLCGMLGMCCAAVCAATSLFQVRETLRSKAGLKVAPCNDCCVVYCCGPCAACQEARVLKVSWPGEGRRHSCVGRPRPSLAPQAPP